MEGKINRLLIIIIAIFLIIAGYELFVVKDHTNLLPSDNSKNSKNSITFLTTNLPPFSYINREGKFRGSLVELVHILADRTNTTYTLEILPMSSAYGRTISTPNTALFPLGMNEERKPLFKWIGPVDVIDYAYFGRSTDTRIITSEEEIRKTRTIAVPKSTARHSILIEKKIKNLLLLSNDAACIQAVLDQKADVWFGPMNLYKLDRQSLGDNLNHIKMVFQSGVNPLYIGFNIDTPDSVIEKWQREFVNLEPEVKSQIMEHQYPYFCTWIGCTYCDENSSPSRVIS